MSMYIVYWAHTDLSADPFASGYIGITKNSLASRRRGHYKASRKKKTPFYDALKKYDDKLIWEVLHENLSQKQALELEYYYRPTPGIGWNHDAGGSIGVTGDWYLIPENRKKFVEITSERTKTGIQKNDSREARSQRARKIWENALYRESVSARFRGENNFCFGKKGSSHPAYGHKKTVEGRKSIAEANRRREVTVETREKISKSRIARYQEQKARRQEKITAERELRKQEREKKRLAGEFRGEKGRASKVSDADRKEICRRRSAGESYRAIAEDYPIGLTGIRAICVTWGRENGYFS